MIKVTYYRDDMRLFLSGHAGYAPLGEDIVCAGISSLACTLGMHTGVKTIQTESQLLLVARENVKENIRDLFDLIVNGMREIAKKYPDCVHVKTF